MLRDLTNPVFVALVPWVLSFTALGLTMGWSYAKDNAALPFLVFIITLYVIGYFISYRSTKEPTGDSSWSGSLVVKEDRLLAILIIELLITVVVLRIFVSHLTYGVSFGSLLTSMKSVDSENHLHYPTLLTYLRSIILSYSICLSVIRFRLGESASTVVRSCFIAQLVIATLNCVTMMNRTSVLLVAVSIGSAFVLINRLNNRQVLRVYAVAGIVFVSFFIVYAYLKYGYKYMDSSFSVDVLLREELMGYLIIPLRCFVEFFSKPFSFGALSLSLRFFSAILAALGVNVDVPTLLMPFYYFSDGSRGNVYTIAQFYISDAGPLYAAIMLFTIGVASGIVFRKAAAGDCFWQYCLCLLMYPAAMQFFADQYISLLSQWIQYVLVGLLVLRTSLILNAPKEDHVSRNTANPNKLGNGKKLPGMRLS